MGRSYLSCRCEASQQLLCGADEETVGFIYFIVSMLTWITSEFQFIPPNRLFSAALVLLILAGFGVYIYIDTMGSRERLRSLMGIFILFGFGYAFSTNRSKVRIDWWTLDATDSDKVFW